MISRLWGFFRKEFAGLARRLEDHHARQLPGLKAHRLASVRMVDIPGDIEEPAPVTISPEVFGHGSLGFRVAEIK